VLVFAEQPFVDSG